jgi:hypothetical protein
MCNSNFLKDNCLTDLSEVLAAFITRATSTRLHGATSQKTVFLLTAAKNWNLCHFLTIGNLEVKTTSLNNLSYTYQYTDRHTCTYKHSSEIICSFVMLLLYIENQGSPWGICGGQSGTGKSYASSPSYHHHCSISTHVSCVGRTMGPLAAAVPQRHNLIP